MSEYLCTAGPGDRPFEERHEQFPVAAMVEGTFSYRAHKVAMDLVDFELPKKAVVANIHSPDNLKERCLRQLSVVRCLKKARRAGGPDDVAKVINGGGEEPSPDHAPHGHVC